MAMCYKLHPRVINDLTDLLDSHSNLLLTSTGIIYSDNTVQNPLNQPISLELSVISDLRVLGTQEITVLDADGYEVYKATPILIDDAVTTAEAPVVRWDNIPDKPTTFKPSTHVHAWADITSGKPTTIAGYGITDAFTQALADARYPQLSIQYTNPTWLAGIDSSIIKTGTIDPARLPVMPTQAPIVSTGDLTALTTGQQAQIISGTIVTTTDGNRYVYNTGDKTLVASYIQLADITPDWSVISGRPTTVSYWSNDAGYAAPNSIMNWTNQHSFNAQVTFNDYVLLKGHNIVTYLWSDNAFSDIRLSGQGFIRLDAETMTDAVANYSDAFSAGYNGKDRWRVYADGHMDWYGGTTIAGPFITSITPSTTYGMVIGSALKVDGKITANGVNVSDTLVSLVNNQANFQPKLPSGSTLDYIDGTGAIQAFPTKMTPYAHTHAWSDITSGKPTTLAGYGITDAASSSHTHTFASLTSKPTTLAGYGITDAATSTHTHTFASLTSKPTTLSGYGITDAVGSSDSRLSDARTPSNNAAIVQGSVNNSGAYGKRTTGLGNTANAINGVLDSGFYDSAATTNPNGNWMHIINSAHNNNYAGNQYQFQIGASFSNSINQSWGPEGYWVRTICGTAQVGAWRRLWHDGNLTGNQTGHYHSADRDWANITSKPTTLSGYGITDAASSTHTHTFASLTSKPTTLAGYGITDAVGSSDSRLSDARTPTAHTHAWTSGLTGVPSQVAILANATTHGSLKLGNSVVGGWHAIEGSDANLTRVMFNDIPGNNICGFYGLNAAKTSSLWYVSWDRAGNMVDGWVPWSRLTSIPSTFTPSAHNQAWSTITGTPTTLAGYGITDAASSTHTHTFASLTSKPTTLSGYGITDAASSTHTHTSINVSNTNETVIANGYATTGNLWINYRGATSAITTYTFGNGLTNGGKASIDALNGVFSGTVTATGAISGGSFSTAGSIAVNGYTITGTKINDWDNASVLRHLHSNITNLNNINQNLSTADSPSWIGASVGKGSTTGNYNILTFNTERSWAFTKTGDGASTGLNLVELSGQKNFNIGYSSDGLNVTSLAFNILTNQTQSSIQLNSWGTWTHNGTLSASGIYSGNAFIGTHTAHTSWAEFCHRSMRGSATGYNVLCSSDGTLNLNAPSGKAINFSNNNGASIATFDSTGFKVNGALVTSGLIGQWNTAWSRIAGGRLCEDAYTGEDTISWITRMGRGNHWGRIHGVHGAPLYYNYMLIRETTGTKYSVIGCAADGNWYVGEAAYNANLTTYNKIWTNADFSSVAVNRINNSDSTHGFTRLYRSDDQSKYYLRHGWTSGQWYGNSWRLTCANDLGDSQSGINTVAVDYSSLSLKSYSLTDAGKYQSNLDTGFKDNSYGLWAGSVDAPTGTTPFGNSWTWLQEWGHSDGGWRAQMGIHYFSDSLAYRRKANGTWQPWKYVVSSDASGNVTIGGTFTAANIYGKLSPTPNNVAILQGIYLNRNCAGTVVSIVGGTVHLQQAIDAADNFFCILHVTGATVINETPYQMWYRGTMYGAGTTISTNLNGCMPVYFRQGQFYIG